MITVGYQLMLKLINYICRTWTFMTATVLELQGIGQLNMEFGKSRKNSFWKRLGQLSAGAAENIAESFLPVDIFYIFTL